MENGIGSNDSAFSSVDTLNNVKESHKKDAESVKSQSKKTDSSTKEKHLAGFFKNSFKTLSIPKKTPVEKDKNEPSRFLGEGVTFKAKLIGILEVEEARGDRMCQEALFELKMAVRAAGEHKQRIVIVIAIDGIRLRDEKTGDCLHHHPVHKISFIAQDVADSRAFGYIFGSPDTSHRFFGIKTDKAASQVVMAMRDLFQAVYEVKKREVDMAKQNIEQHQLKYGSSFFLDSLSATSSKSSGGDQLVRKQISKEETNKNAKNRTPQTASVITDLMDLELELSSLQQGLSQMEKLTPSDPFGPSPSIMKEDPFGDSFTPPLCITTPPPAKLPPPPMSGERRKIGSSSSATEVHWFDKETQDLFASEKKLAASETNFANKKEESAAHVEKPLTMPKDLYDIFTELDPLSTGRSKPYTDKKDFFQELKNPPKKQLNDLKSDSVNDNTISAGIAKTSLFAEDNENFYADHLRKYNSVDSDQRITLAEELAKSDHASYEMHSDPFETSFANFASLHGSNQGTSDGSVPQRSPLSYTYRNSPTLQLEKVTSQSSLHTALKSSSNSSRSVYKSIVSGDDVDSPTQMNEPFLRSSSSPQWGCPNEDPSKQKIVIDLRRVLSIGDDTDNDSPVAEETRILKNSDMSSPCNPGNISSDSFESIPEPPPRPITSPITSQPPPLPPKKLHLPVTMKPPPRPTVDTTSHYDYIENYESVGSRRMKNTNGQIPPLPAPARKPKFNQEIDRSYARHRPHRHVTAPPSESDYYLTPISKSRPQKEMPSHPKRSLNITISQLASTGFEDLAAMLKVPAARLSRMTLKELTECLSQLSDADCQKLENDMNCRNGVDKDSRLDYQSLKESFEDDSAAFKVNFEERFPVKATCSSAPPHDKYAVFRELIDQQEKVSSSPSLDGKSDVQEDRQVESCSEETKSEQKDEDDSDKYAALRTITIEQGRKNSEANDKPDNDEEKTAESNNHKDKQSEHIEDAEVASQDANPDTISTEPLNAEAASTETDGDEEKCKNEEGNVVAAAEPPVGKNWAKFEEPELSEDKPTEWQDEALLIQNKKQYNNDDYNNDDEFDEEDEEEENEFLEYANDNDNEDSDENWSSKRSVASSWEESSWRENGWSDRDSLYDETEAPRASHYPDHHLLRNRGYHRKHSPKKSADQSPWEEEPSWPSQANRARAYKECYDGHKVRTPPRGAASNEQKGFNPKEEDELALLKMVLGKKRLKALEEQLFKHYHEQLSEKESRGPHTSKKYSAKAKPKQYKTPPPLSLAYDQQYELSAKASRGCGKKYYTVQRPKSADKGHKPLLLRADDSGELFMSTAKKYRKPYSHDELSISEEERWVSHRSPNSKKNSHSRNHSQNSQHSPFEDNFSLTQTFEFQDEADPSVDKLKAAPAAINMPPLLNVVSNAKGRSQSRFVTSKKSSSSTSGGGGVESKKQSDLQGYSPYDNVKFTHRSRESSQRESPFEDDFTGADKAGGSEKESEWRMADDEVFFSGSAAARHSSESTSHAKKTSRGKSGRNARYDAKRLGSEGPPNNKYYENVELWKKMSPSDAYYEKRITSPKERYSKQVKKSSNVGELATASPKRGKRVESRHHDPFQDNSQQRYKMRTVPRSAPKTKSKSKQNYDSGSDSPEIAASGNKKNSFSFNDEHNNCK